MKFNTELLDEILVYIVTGWLTPLCENIGPSVMLATLTT